MRKHVALFVLFALCCTLPTLARAQHKQLLGSGTNLTASTGLKISFTVNAFVQGSPTQRFVKGTASESGKRVLTVNTKTLSMVWDDANDRLTVECEGLWNRAPAKVKYIATRKPSDFYRSHIKIEVYPKSGGLWTAEGDPAMCWVDVQ